MREEMMEYYEWFLSNNLLARVGIVIGVIVAVVLAFLIVLCLLICIDHLRAFFTGGFTVCLVGWIIYGIYIMVQDGCFYKEILIGAGVLAVLLWCMLFISSIADDEILDAFYAGEQMLSGTGTFLMDCFSLGFLCLCIALPFIAFGWMHGDSDY